jgi:hypothetical protein
VAERLTLTLPTPSARAEDNSGKRVRVERAPPKG